MANQKPEPILDPRGKQKRQQLKLAPRVSMDTLKRGPILFYDNGKAKAYPEIFRRIKVHFVQSGVSNFIDYAETARGKTSQDMKNFASKLAGMRPVAAVVGLGDMGVSPATTVVTIGLEESGVPTVYITAPPGHGLARATAFYRAGNLCLCPLDIFQGSADDDVRNKVDAAFPLIIECLTTPATKLAGRVKIDLPYDQDPPAADGFIHFDFDTDADLSEQVFEYFNSLHIGDGLPVIPPTLTRYERMFAYFPYDPATVLVSEIGPSGADITVRDVAVGAVMAGAEPRYLPVILTAFKALANPKYNFLAGVTTSHPGGDMLLVSGPLAQELGVSGGQGCMGPGFKANMTIGRTINLTVTNVCRSVPGYADLDCLSSQAGIAYCFAEEPKLTPWPTVNAELFDSATTTVMALKAEPPHDIMDMLSSNALDLLDTIVDSCTTLGTNNAYIPGPLILVLTLDHAEILNREGWSKDKIREYIHARAANPAPMLRGRGLDQPRPPAMANLHPMPVTRSPKDIEIVVAGGKGGHSAVILPWALMSDAIVERVLLPDGSVPKSIEEFRKR